MEEPHESKNSGNTMTNKGIYILEVGDCATEDYKMVEVQKNQYNSLYWCGAWQWGSTHQARGSVQRVWIIACAWR